MTAKQATKAATSRPRRRSPSQSAAKAKQRAGRTRKLKPFTLAHFEAWAARHILDTGEPWTLDPFERAFVTDVFRGTRICWLVVPEGNGKTTLLAGIALYHIEFTPAGYVAVAASARDQAEWIYRQAASLVSSSERLGEFRCLEGYRRIKFEAGESRIQVFSADDRSGDGAIASLFILDELHRHKDLALYRTWTGKLKKRGGQLLAISTAGEVGSEFEQERTRFRQTAARVRRAGAFTRAQAENAVLHDWALEEGCSIEDLEAVKRANPSPRITVDDLREKRALPGMTPEHFARFTGNRASRAPTSAITEAEWASAKTRVQIPEGEPVWLGLDLAWKHDTTAAVPLWFRSPEFRLFGPAEILTPPRDGTSLDPHLVEATLLGIHQRNPVHTVVMDTTKGEQLAEWIREELGAEVVDRSQTNAFAVMDYERFMEALRFGWLKHAGDPGLTRHVLNAVGRVLPGGDTRFNRPHESRLGKHGQQDMRVIDALTAASMVHCVAAGELVDDEDIGAMVVNLADAQ